MARSHAEYVPGTDLVDMIKEDLVAERVAIASYIWFLVVAPIGALRPAVGARFLERNGDAVLAERAFLPHGQLHDHATVGLRRSLTWYGIEPRTAAVTASPWRSPISTRPPRW